MLYAYTALLVFNFLIQLYNKQGIDAGSSDRRDLSISMHNIWWCSKKDHTLSREQKTLNTNLSLCKSTYIKYSKFWR